MEDLTIENLKATYDAYIMARGNDSIDKLRTNALLKALEKFSGLLDKVYVKKSNIHGNGVFASRNILKGEIVTFYPAHYIFSKEKGPLLISFDKVEPSVVSMSLVKSDLVEGKDISFETKRRYSYYFNKDFSICGDPDIFNDPSFVGHIVNDGLVIKKKSRDLRYLYNRISPTKNNSIYFEISYMCCAIVATRDINKDDEILVSYGTRYWEALVEE